LKSNGHALEQEYCVLNVLRNGGDATLMSALYRYRVPGKVGGQLTPGPVAPRALLIAAAAAATTTTVAGAIFITRSY